MTYTLLNDLPQTTSTPDDYLRVHFDPSTLPEKRIVGMLACQRDPLLQTLRTRVYTAKSASIAAPPPQKGKATKKKGTPIDTPTTGASTPTGKLWEVETLDTIIFPEGGGQPSDTGRMYLLDPNGGRSTSFVIEGCLRRKLDAVHLVRIPEGEQAILDDIVGQEIDLEVDWDRRQDQMTIHTAQHLLSAVLDRYELKTLSWAVQAYPSLEPPYVELPRGLTWAEAEEVERKCNALIKEGRKVWIDVTVQSGKGISDGDKVVDVNGIDVERESRGVPKDYEGGVIRFCNIDRYDCNACCGTQCPTLTLCGSVHIIPPSCSPSSTKPSSLVPTRLYFTAGPRAILYTQQASRQISTVAQSLGISRGETIERVAKLDNQRIEILEREKGLRSELIQLHAENASRQYLNSQNKGIVWLHREGKATHDFEFLGGIGSAFLSLVQSLPSVDGEQSPVPIIISTSSLPGISPSLLLIQSSDNEIAKNLNTMIKTALDTVGDTPTIDGKPSIRVKGGGAKGRYMSKVDGKWGKAEQTKLSEIIAQSREQR